MLTKLSKMIKHGELPQYSGCGLTKTDAMIVAKEFPSGIPMTPNGKQLRWAEEELLAWQNERLAMRNDIDAMQARAKKLRANFTPKLEKPKSDDPPKIIKTKLKPPQEREQQRKQRRSA